MSVLNQIGLGKLGNSAPDGDDQRVLDLFRNRAELKKAYSELQDEIFALKERLRQQEGATARVQELLALLESRLEVREQGYSSMVFYQLRRLWRLGHETLAQLAVDLEREHVERERRAFLLEFNRQQFTRRQESEALVTQAQRAALDTRTALRDCEQKISQLNRPWHRFTRREYEQKIQPLKANFAAAEAALNEARERHERLLGEAEAGFAGLSVESRRAINIELIAAAQILCLRLIKSPLLALARDAASRRDVGDSFGTRQECEALMSDIELARAVLEQKAGLPADAKVRAQTLSQSVAYEKADDTVPTSDSLEPAREQRDPLADALDKTAIRQARSRALLEPRPPNVLIEDSWDLMRTLLR